MVEFVRFMVEQFIDEKDKLTVTVTEGEEKNVITVTVAEADMGKIIGKQGRIAKAIRTLVKAAQVKTGKKYSVEIVENKEQV